MLFLRSVLATLILPGTVTVFFRSASLVWYGIVIVAMFVAVILGYEEPALRERFGAMPAT